MPLSWIQSKKRQSPPYQPGKESDPVPAILEFNPLKKRSTAHKQADPAENIS
jgi:hypothetical protein